MKSKIISIASLSILLAVVFTGCKKDDPEPKKNIVKIGAQDNTSIGGFYSLSTKKIFTIQDASKAENQSKIDIYCFYEEGVNDIAVACPNLNVRNIFSDYDSNDPENTFDPLDPQCWEIRNRTTFIMVEGMTPEQFDAIEDGDVTIEGYYTETNTRRARYLQPGDVYAFKTQDETFGIFIVKEVVQGATGYVEFEYKTKK